MLWKKNKVDSNLSTNKVRGRLFYGWVVAIAGAGVIFAACSFQYSFGVFLKPIINRFGWSRAAVSGCVSARSILTGLITPVTGALSDKYGLKKIVLVGIVLAGLGYILASRITSLWHLYLFLSILMGIGMSAIYAPIIATVTRWFGGKSALAIGIVYSGFSLAQIVLPLVATYFIVQHSWEVCFVILGLTAWVIGISAWNFLKSPPTSITSLPPEESARGGDSGQAYEPEILDNGGYTLLETLHTTTFWFFFLIYMVYATCYQMVVVHIVAVAIDVGIGVEAAAFILTLCGITNTLGRLAPSVLTSKLGIKTILTFCLAIQVPILFLLTGATDLWLFNTVALLFGLAYGIIAPLIPMLIINFFGGKSLGAIFGTLTSAYLLGVAIGPLLAGYIFDVTGSYSTAFSSAAIAMAMAFLLSLLLKSPKKKATIT